MKKMLPYLKNILLPCLVFSAITGVLTGVLIFLFKLASSHVIALSSNLYALVRQNPTYIPLLVLGAAALGLLAALILRAAPNCRGGGIPTSIALLRGLIEFKWIKSVFLLFASAMLTYLGGVPLGNEGPSVQMGTAVGRGTVRLFAKKHRAWDRYIMTGGACAGFAAATGAPITGILFAFEEAHRRFSPMIFMSAAMTVIFGSATNELLCKQAGISASMFDLVLTNVLPLQFLWVTILIGIVCGVCAIFFTKLYRVCGTVLKTKLECIPFTAKLVTVFVSVALVGLASGYLLGSGHDLIHELLHGAGVWYLLILYFCVRAILLIVANNVGITGGLFVPSLVFGAILGALCGRALIFSGLLDEQHYVITVIVGMASFLAASSRTPITAVTFAAEALCGFSNVLPVAAGVTFAYLTIETVGVIGFNETVLENKVEAENAGKTAHIVNAYLTVRDGSFAVGKEIRDILWPPTCVILSVDKNPATVGSVGISEGDILHVHYRSYDPPATQALLEALVGEQAPDPRSSSHMGDEHHQTPENS
ncbi:MAG: chloride channel protein [Clostridia bacterium]|nr:chloride channel protein [Clostridia bacterium]